MKKGTKIRIGIATDDLNGDPYDVFDCPIARAFKRKAKVPASVSVGAVTAGMDGYEFIFSHEHFAKVSDMHFAKKDRKCFSFIATCIGKDRLKK